jgi:hypothetical protein
MNEAEVKELLEEQILCRIAFAKIVHSKTPSWNITGRKQ